MRRLLLVALVLAHPGCIDDRLSVEIRTEIYADGTASRRVEYCFERIDTDKGQETVASIDPAKDPLRLFHRFPTGEPWHIHDEAGPYLHTVVVEANLASPNAAEGDFFRQRFRKVPPTRNYVSFDMKTDESGGTYQYLESFIDPTSPLEGVRRLARAFQSKDKAFAERLARSLGAAEREIRSKDIRRVYRESFAEPFAQEVARLADRPVFGPRENKNLENCMDRLEPLSADLAASVLRLVPEAEAEATRKAVDDTLDEIFQETMAELEGGGLPVLGSGGSIRFRVTLVMPGPIVRANSCATGDTVVWEFDDDDLYGRGFEMWARAERR